MQHVHQMKALDEKTHVNDQAYVGPMATRLMNRWTCPLAGRPIQSRCSGMIRSAYLRRRRCLRPHVNNRFAREGVKLCLLSLGG